MANYYVNAAINGLRTYDFPVPFTDTYVVAGTLELVSQAPTAAQGPGGGGIGTGSVPGLPIASQVVVTVALNSSTVYTGPVGAKGFKTGVNATAGDIIHITLSSSLAQDQQPNAVKCNVSIFEGEE